jgi:membrane-associated phospholipid phosphatase
VGRALVVTCCTRNRLGRVASAVGAGMFAVTVGFARVYRGLHHPTDVVVGMLFGLACLTCAAIAVRAASRRMPRGESADARPETPISNDLRQKNRLIGVTAASTSR